MPATRVRRCSWEFGVRCHEPANVRLTVTYLGAPTDRDVFLCAMHADQAGDLVRPGWAIASVTPVGWTTPAPLLES